MRKLSLAALAGLVVLLASFQARAGMDCSEATFCLHSQTVGDVTSFTAINRNPYLPLTVVIELELDNLAIGNGSSGAFVLNGGESRKLFTLSPKRLDDAWEYAYEYSWIEGNYTARHDAGHRYRLPYEADRTFEVSQGCNGEFSHTESGKFAIDFDMPSRTPVLAARGGVVVDIKQDSHRGGAHERFENDANYITILHDDGTLGHHFHLHPNTVQVALGEQVAAGDRLARSGNTGFSTGPHLHFEVNEVRLGRSGEGDPESESVPITFDARRGPVSCPADGTRLRVK